MAASIQGPGRDWACNPARIWFNASVRTEDSNSEAQAHRAVFATTHWSVVLAAGDPASPQAAEALEKLCRTYGYPLYAYVRRQGYGAEDAQNLPQLRPRGRPQRRLLQVHELPRELRMQLA